MIRAIVCAVMNKACEWSGHRLGCYNRPLWANRLWGWSLGIGQTAPGSVTYTVTVAGDSDDDSRDIPLT